MLRGQQIGLLDEFEGGVFGPGRVLETPVARLGRNLRRRRAAADHALRRFAPEFGVVGPEPGLHLPHAGGVGHHLAGQLHECAADIQRIRVRPAGLLLRSHEILHDFPAAFGDGRELLGSGSHIGRCFGMRFGHGAGPFRPLANKVRSHKQASRPRRQRGRSDAGTSGKRAISERYASCRFWQVDRLSGPRRRVAAQPGLPGGVSGHWRAARRMCYQFLPPGRRAVT